MTFESNPLSRRGVGMVAAAATAVALSLSAGSAGAETIRLLSGSTGGTWDGISGVLKTMLETHVPDTTVEIRPGASYANAKAVGTGQTDLTWMLATVAVEARKGDAPFDGPVDMCNIASFHPTVVQYVTNNPEIQSLDDLKGKRVSTLQKGSGTEGLARQMLGFHGMTEADLAQYNFGSFPDASTMLKDNHIDIFMGTAGLPAGGIADMFASVPNLRMLPVSDEDMQKLKESNAAYTRFTLKAGTYPNQTEDVATAAFPTHLATNCSFDEEQAYQITKAVIENFKDFGAVITVIGDYSLSDLTIDMGIPFHPGAIRAYKEAGAM